MQKLSNHLLTMKIINFSPAVGYTEPFKVSLYYAFVEQFKTIQTAT